MICDEKQIYRYIYLYIYKYKWVPIYYDLANEIWIYFDIVLSKLNDFIMKNDILVQE